MEFSDGSGPNRLLVTLVRPPERYSTGIETPSGTADAAAKVPRLPQSFRADIQALRAVAVVAVVLYHLWPERVPGGFVGVDIFFVISGFLITQHLVGEIRRTGSISLTQFWARRIRRLLPAAFLVLVVSLLFLFLLMPNVIWQESLKEIGASAAYVENWLLGIHAVDYLAADNSASLVQHYWSLSVEEQFYIVWPLLLLVALKAGRLFKRTTPLPTVRCALAFVALASFAVSITLTNSKPPLAFFATQTRAWEFAVGGLIALAPSLVLGTREATLRAGASWAGLAVILYSCLFITGNKPFPGSIALIPVIGAGLVVASGMSSVRWSSSRVAALKPVQWLGDYSYSIYLWHWPLIIVAPWLLHGPTNWASKLVILVGSLVLAYLTKRFVEDPVRTGKRWNVRRWPNYAFAAAGMAVILGVSFGSYLEINKRIDALAVGALAKVVNEVPCYGAEAIVASNECASPFAPPAGLDAAFAAADIYAGSEACQQEVDVATLHLCTFGEPKNPTRTIAVVGNSHAAHLIPALELYGKKLGWKIILAAKTDCMGLITTPVGTQKASDTCLTWSAELHRSLLAMPKLDAVIFASHAASETYLAGLRATPRDLATAQDRVLATWTTFVTHGIPVIVIEDVPGMRPNADPECIAKTSVSYDPCAVDRPTVVVSNLMSTLAARNQKLVTYLPVSQYFCDAKTCHGIIGGVVVYSDSHHLTATYSRSLARYIGPEVAAVFHN